MTLGGKFKNLALATSVGEWNGRNSSKSVKEILTTVCNWSHTDKVNIVKANLMCISSLCQETIVAYKPMSRSLHSNGYTHYCILE
jgi:hypothetical protein